MPAYDSYLYFQNINSYRLEGSEIMRRMGICKKCGEYKIVQEHHSKGYLPPYGDFTEPYCRSCDAKAHAKAKRDGKCGLAPWKISKLTASSYARRTRNIVKEAYKKKLLLENIQLCDSVTRSHSNYL